MKMRFHYYFHDYRFFHMGLLKKKKKNPQSQDIKKRFKFGKSGIFKKVLCVILALMSLA